MDTKERKAAHNDTGPAPAPDPIWRPTHRSRGEKTRRKAQEEFKAPIENFLAPPLPDFGRSLTTAPTAPVNDTPTRHGGPVEASLADLHVRGGGRACPRAYQTSSTGFLRSRATQSRLPR